MRSVALCEKERRKKGEKGEKGEIERKSERRKKRGEKEGELLTQLYLADILHLQCLSRIRHVF